MASSLLYVDEINANFPDNVSQLIVPVSLRSFVSSYVRGIGFLESTDSITVPITDGVPTIVNPLLVNPSTISELWTTDGNNLMLSNYAALTDTTVPAGYTKLAQFVGVLALEKAAGGADNYTVSFTKNGVQIGLDEDLQYAAAGAQVITIVLSNLADVSTADTYGIQITGNGTADDLTLNYFSQQVSDGILLTNPNP